MIQVIKYQNIIGYIYRNFLTRVNSAMNVLPKKKFFAIFSVLICCLCFNASSQSLSSEFGQQDIKSTVNNSEKHKPVKISYNFIFLSLKGGYHTANEPDKDWGFEKGWITNISAGAVLFNTWEFGIDADFWESANDNYRISNEYSYKRDYKAHSVKLIFKYRLPLLNEIAAIKLGLSIGNYKISAKSTDGYYNSDQYLSIGPGISFEIWALSFLSFEAEARYNRLFNHEHINQVIQFTLGPKLFLKLP